MSLCEKQIGMWHTGAKSRSSDPNRDYVFNPCLGGIGFLEPAATDPLNGACPAENSWQQITDGEVFNLLVTICGPDRRAP